MKSRNHVIYSNDEAMLKRLAVEYQVLGREIQLEPGKLIVLALPLKKGKKK